MSKEDHEHSLGHKANDARILPWFLFGCFSTLKESQVWLNWKNTKSRVLSSLWLIYFNLTVALIQ